MFSKIKLIALGSLAATAGAIGLQAPASAAPSACATTAYAAATVFSTTTPFACQVGDKIFSDFKNASGLNGKTLKFTQVDTTSYQIDIGLFPTATAIAMDFTVEATDPGMLIVDYIYNKTGGGYISSQTINATGPLNKLAFTTSATLSGSSSSARGLQFYLTQNAPGPLPLAGAAIAFGYSRKLRNRARRFA
jgi:hypothetical protein